jgi:hypothetical protein
MLIDSYKGVLCDSQSAMLYLTTNCRLLPVDTVKDIMDRYNDKFNSFIIVSDSDAYNDLQASIYKPPVTNIFTKFGTYIYTPTIMKWDGSPRFPVECKIHNKDVIYDSIDEKYLDHDTGLKYRLHDMKSIDNIKLTSNDSILDIV